MRVLYLFVALCVACSPVSKKMLTRNMTEMENKFQDHTGFIVYDPAKKKTVFSYNGEKYFTPASNTKIFTFFTALTILGDSIPGLTYTIQGDSLIFKGTGDPSFLYSEVVRSNRVYDFLKNSTKELYFYGGNSTTTALGPGWSWSDYTYAYSSERSAFPLFGNTYSVTLDPVLRVKPAYFKKYFWLADSTERANVIRDIGTNRTEYYPGRTTSASRQRNVPFKTDPLVVANLLSDTLSRKVNLLTRPVAFTNKNVLYSVPSDSLYKVMMQESDNFIAEQLLLVCAGILTDTLQPELAIQYMKINQLADLPDSPVWVDGSGLSRYNLFTPRSIIALWEKIYTSVERERLFPLLAIGGKTGTIKTIYRNDPPYIYGKTGTLRNNHALSGFLVTKKGETLLFSFMSNNFTVPASDVRAEMEKILKQLYTSY
jgi:serine-type D-Ala-D-Ala carboxypeptidase/endopeptidase (penicillin-binding protein 4)